MTKVPYPDMSLFHKLWTRAVENADYDKSEWRALEQMIEQERERTVLSLCDWLGDRGSANRVVVSLIRREFLIGNTLDSSPSEQTADKKQPTSEEMAWAAAYGAAFAEMMRNDARSSGWDVVLHDEGRAKSYRAIAHKVADAAVKDWPRVR